MVQADNQKFGKFVAELRKEKQLTQKELAEKLFVSDKAVSKWETGQSMPGVELLIPLADVLGVTVTELLKGERIREESRLDREEVEELVTCSVNLTVGERRQAKERRQKWAKIYVLCLAAACGECFLFWKMGLMHEGIKIGLWTVEPLVFIFGGWFCFLARERLPAFYDENKISFVSDGVFRMNMPGVSFNNRNWPRILAAGRVWCLAVGVFYPLLGVLVGALAGAEEWMFSGLILPLAAVFSIFIPIYAAGRK